MSDTPTPRTDAVAEPTWQEGEVVLADFARQLEREANQLRDREESDNRNLGLVLQGKKPEEGYRGIAVEVMHKIDQLRAEVERLKKLALEQSASAGKWSSRCDQWREVATWLSNQLNQSNSTLASLAAWKHDPKQRIKICHTQQGSNAVALAAYERLAKEGK